MSDRHGWGALLPVYNIPETFGTAISYEGQLHWFLENWNEVAEYANDLEQPTVTVGTVATPESNDTPPSVTGVAEGTDLTLNFTLPDKMIKPLGEWSASVAYESLSLVNDGGGNTYVSKAPSPAGTPLTDSTIWMNVGVSSANYIPITGGTITGNLAVDGTTTLGDPLGVGSGGTGLAASPSMLVNLGSTTAANVMQAAPRPGVTGTLPIANGGTGATTAANAPWLPKAGGTMTGQIVDLKATNGLQNRSSTTTDATIPTSGNSAITFYHDYDGSNHRVGYMECTREPTGVYRSYIVTNPATGKNFGFYLHSLDDNSLSFNTNSAEATKAIVDGLGLNPPSTQTFYWSGGSYVTGGQKQICFSVPFRPPLGATRCEVTMVKCIVRQDGAYKFGSDASTFATPTSAEVWNLSLDAGQAELLLTYPADSTTSNNAPCGVRAQVTLTFS